MGAGGFHSLPEGGSQVSLAFDGAEHLFPPLLEAAQISQFGFQGSQGGVIHTPVELFAVAGDEGDGVALIQKRHHLFHISLVLPQFLGQSGDYGIHSCILSSARPEHFQGGRVVLMFFSLYHKTENWQAQKSLGVMGKAPKPANFLSLVRKRGGDRHLVERPKMLCSSVSLAV